MSKGDNGSYRRRGNGRGFSRRIKKGSSRKVTNYLLDMAVPAHERVYIACTYRQKDEAKLAGAHWDAKHKLWWFTQTTKHRIKGRWRIVRNPHLPIKRSQQCRDCQRAIVSDGTFVCRACLDRDKVRSLKTDRRYTAPPVGLGGVILTTADLNS